MPVPRLQSTRSSSTEQPPRNSHFARRCYFGDETNVCQAHLETTARARPTGVLPDIQLDAVGLAHVFYNVYLEMFQWRT